VRPDGQGHIGAEAAKELFSRLWKLLNKARACDAVLDLTSVRSVDSRFVRELAFLRKYLHHQHRRVVLSNVSDECSYLLDIE
jgi:anti-anti-sigma regulatory factor